MAGKVLQKFLDFHRNQQSILHTAYLKDGEGKRDGMKGWCVCNYGGGGWRLVQIETNWAPLGIMRGHTLRMNQDMCSKLK